MTTINHNDPDETIRPLEEDNDPPFSPPDDIPTGNNEPTDLASDVDIDEAYHEGESSAMESTQQPEHESAVESFDPESDNRN